MKELDKDALLEEAIERGYGKGIKIKAYFPEYSSTYSDDREYIMNDCKPSYEEKEKAIRMGGSIIYHKGKWAEIVEEPKVETKFEKGKWYYYEHGENGKDKYYLKYDKHNSDKFYYIEYIKLMKNAKAIRQVSDIPFKFMYNIKEVSLSEIQQYLPDEHPDKIKEVKEEVKSVERWSIGSYVVCIREDYQGSTHTLIKEPKIPLGTICSITHNFKDNTLGTNFSHWVCNIDMFKWFPTLQEAQKFSDKLLGKSKTGLSRKDLIDGEFYKVEVDDGFLIMKLSFKGSDLNRVNAAYVSNMDSEWRFRQESTPWVTNRKITKADFSEVRWLKTCIKQDKFIEQSELNKYDDEGNLMGSKEYPEYYECINIPDRNKNWVEGKIYKIRNSKQLESYKNFIDEAGEPNGFCPHNHKHFKPSTREAYEAQFKKDEEFKVGDKVICIKNEGFKIDGFNCSECLKIGKLYTVTYETRQYGSSEELGINVEGDGYTHPISNFRKALSHEIPAESSVKQYPLVFENCISPNVQLSWKTNALYHTDLGLLSPIPTPVYLDRVYTKKTPDLIDKTKVKVEIKRTKVKQIKL
jgi:hypothetical protein